jgi:glycosyltransferase involved in cell wall biosynthesis
MSKPNLLYVSPVSPTPDGVGLAQRAFNNLKALSGSYHVYLLVMPPGRRNGPPHPSLGQWCRKQKEIPLHPLWDFWLCGAWLIKKALRFFMTRENFCPPEWDAWSEKRIRRGERAFCGIDFSVIHVFRLYMVPVLEPFLRRFSGRLQLDLDDVESRTRAGIARVCRENGEIRKAERHERQAEFYREKESLELHRFARVFVCSSMDQAWVAGRYGLANVEVLPNVVATPESADVPEERRPPARLLLCGNFRYFPNLDGLNYFVRDILPVLNESAPEKFLVDVVGPGLKGKLKRRVDRDPRMIYHGRVADMGALFKAADAVLVPLRAGGGTRIKILEGLSHGKPVISTRKGAEGLPFRHQRELVLADDAGEFAGHCRQFLDDPRRWRELGSKGRDRVKELFSLARVEKVLSRRPAAGGTEAGARTSAEEPIDVVYTWVDGSSAEFKRALFRELEKPGSPAAHGLAHRFRDNQELRYSLRSLEAYAPWTGHVFIVTNGQVPPWLRADHSRISIIDHRAIFPEDVPLPTFNSNAIELCLHRIPGLSRRFLYLNDDLFFGRGSVRGDFLTGSGGIRFYLEPIVISPPDAAGSSLTRSYAFSQEIVQRLYGIKGERLLPAHAPQLYDRDILRELEGRLAAEFGNTRRNRFRSPDDLVLRILFYYHLMESPRQIPRGHLPVRLRWGSPDYMFWMLTGDFLKTAFLFQRLLRRRPRFFCINDDVKTVARHHFPHFVFRRFLRLYFPRRSSFEK